MTNTAALDELERSLAAVVRLLADRSTVDDIARRSGYDLPPASWSLLEHLDARGALRVSDIAVCHGVDVSSVTPRLKRLEQTGLVSRGAVPNDARASLITISAEGVRALESVHSARRVLLAQAVGDSDAAQLSVAAGLLSHIVEHLSGALEPAIRSGETHHA